MIKKDIEMMHDFKILFKTVFISILLVIALTNFKETIFWIISFIFLSPLAIWLDYKLNPHKYKQDS